jgi:hypothetical protein
MNYLNDFLHMIYKPIVEGELQVTIYVAKNGNCELVCMMQLKNKNKLRRFERRAFVWRLAA